MRFVRLERGEIIAIVPQFSHRDPFAFDDPVYRKQPLVKIGVRDEEKRHEGIVFQADL